MLHISTPLHALTYSALNSASAANDMTALTIVDTVSTAQLFFGSSMLLDVKKCPPAWLLAFVLLKCDALLWTASTMLLALYVRMASLLSDPHVLCLCISLQSYQ